MKRNIHCTRNGFVGRVKSEIAKSKNNINCRAMKRQFCCIRNGFVGQIKNEIAESKTQ
jgi:hypothetical protein